MKSLTPAEQKAILSRRETRTLVEVLSFGIAEQCRNVYDSGDVQRLEELLQRHLRPAVENADLAQQRFEDSMHKPRKRRAKKKGV
jgi:hypothetical protein